MTEQEVSIVRAGIWAERIASEPAVNAERRAWFESVKAVLVDRRAMPSGNKPSPSNVVYIQQLQNAAGCQAYGLGVGLGVFGL